MQAWSCSINSSIAHSKKKKIQLNMSTKGKVSLLPIVNLVLVGCQRTQLTNSSPILSSILAGHITQWETSYPACTRSWL